MTLIAPPLTEEEIAGRKACRFVTTTVDRESAWGFTNDEGVYDAIRGERRFDQIQRSEGGPMEYQCLSSHPQVVSLVLQLMAGRAA